MSLSGSLSSPARLGNHRDRQSDSALLLVRPLNLAILPENVLFLITRDDLPLPLLHLTVITASSFSRGRWD